MPALLFILSLVLLGVGIVLLVLQRRIPVTDTTGGFQNLLKKLQGLPTMVRNFGVCFTTAAIFTASYFLSLCSFEENKDAVGTSRPLDFVYQKMQLSPLSNTPDHLAKDLQSSLNQPNQHASALDWCLKFTGLRTVAELKASSGGEAKTTILKEVLELLKDEKDLLEGATYEAAGDPVRTMVAYLDLDQKKHYEKLKFLLEDPDISVERAYYMLTEAHAEKGALSISFEKKAVALAYLSLVREESQKKSRFLRLLGGPIQYFTLFFFFLGISFLTQLRSAPAVSRKMVEFSLSAIPSLGFVGTVWGISEALGNADLVVKATDIASRGRAVEAVTSLLGVAFDTTLVALVAGVILLFTYTLSRKA